MSKHIFYTYIMLWELLESKSFVLLHGLLFETSNLKDISNKINYNIVTYILQ